MRFCARGPSGTFTASTPASLIDCTDFTMASGFGPFGGVISIVVTNSPAAILRPQFERSGSGTGSTPALFFPFVSFSMTTKERRGESGRTASRMILMCSGVVPQQPPRNFTPLWISRFAYLPMYSGEAMYICRPLTSRGRPAFGWQEIFLAVTALISSIASSITSAPTEQFRPTTSAPAASRRLATVAGVSP